MDVSICGQLSSMEAISHNAVGRKEGGGTAAVGKRTKLFVRSFSAPLFKFTLCSALPRSLQESDEKQPESREEKERGRTENQCNNAGSLLMMFSNQCSQPAILSSLLLFSMRKKSMPLHTENHYHSPSFKAMCLLCGIDMRHKRYGHPKWGPLTPSLRLH